MGYKKTAIKGVSWEAALRVAIRAVGYLKIALLARILTPEQHGLWGIASFSLAFLEIFTQTGINVFFIQEKERINKYVNTAWVISIFRGIIIALLLLVLAPVISNIFKAPDALSLLFLIAVVPLIRGFINPSIVLFVKNLEFKKEFFLRFSVFVIDTLVAISVAMIWRTPLGFVAGLVAGSFSEVVLTHIFLVPKPRFSYDSTQVKKIIRRGKWVTLAGVFNFLNKQGDDMVVARVVNTGALGLYQNAYKISTLPITEVTQIVSRVTFSIFSRFSEDTERIKRAYFKVTLAVALVVLPFAAVLYLYPREIIFIILGDQWLEAAEALKVLSVFGLISAVLGVSNSVLLSLKRQDLLAKIKSVQFLGLALAIWPLTSRYGIVGAGYATIVGLLVSMPLLIYYLRRVLK